VRAIFDQFGGISFSYLYIYFPISLQKRHYFYHYFIQYFCNLS